MRMDINEGTEIVFNKGNGSTIKRKKIPMSCLTMGSFLGNDWKSLRTFTPATYRVF